jgi:hypothetical protein
MIQVIFPDPEFKVKKEKGREIIFDSFRKKWIVLTPEEWVRQNFLQFLQQVKKYPSSLIAIEKELKLGELKKRFDILVYDKKHQPWMMIECKSMDVKLDEKAMDQVLRYNMGIPVEFIVLTNGHYTYGWHRTGEEMLDMDELPALH